MLLENILLVLMTAILTIIIGHIYGNPSSYNYNWKENNSTRHASQKNNPNKLEIDLMQISLSQLRSLQRIYVGKPEETQIYDTRKKRIMRERSESLKRGRETSRKKQIIQTLEKTVIEWHKLSVDELEKILTYHKR